MTKFSLNDLKIPIRLKLSLSYILIIGITILIVSLVVHYSAVENFHRFFEGGPGGGHGGPRGDRGEIFTQAMRRAVTIAALGTSGIAILISLLMSNVIVSPIQRIIDATKRIAKGHYDERVELKTNDEIDDLAQALNQMASELEKIETLRRTLISNVSHELSTPLTNIVGYLEALEDGVIKGAKPTRETLTLIQEEAKRLQEMVKEVRALSMTENPTFTLNRKPVKLKPLIEKVVRIMKPQWDEKSLKITSKIAPATLTLSADRDRLTQILTNLLSNAIHYTPKNGVITLNAKIAKTSQSPQEVIEIQIQDNGVGISKEELPHVFERFYRADKSRSRKTGGTGIGLTLTKQLVEAHSGTIHITSQPKKGTTVTLRMPKSS